MFRRHRAELVHRQRVSAFDDAYVFKIGRNGDCTTHPTIGARATPRRPEAIGELDAESYTPAVASAGELIVRI